MSSKATGPMHRPPTHKRSACSSGDVPSSKRVFTGGSTSAAAADVGGSNVNVAGDVFGQLEFHLAKAVELSLQFPSSTARLSMIPEYLRGGRNFDDESSSGILRMEATSIAQMQSGLANIQTSFLMLKSMQDDRCKPFEDEAHSLMVEMQNKEKESVAAGRQDVDKVSILCCH